MVVKQVCTALHSRILSCGEFASTYVAPCYCDTCDSIFLKRINTDRGEYLYSPRVHTVESIVTADDGVDFNVFIKTKRKLVII